MAQACAHEDFRSDVTVHRHTRSDDDPTVIGYSANIRVACSRCLEPFIFVGPPVGVLPNEPTISVDAQELRTPLRPTSDPTIGAGLAGFRVNFKERRLRGDN